MLDMLFQDLATAFVKVLSNSKANKQVYNISGEKYVTFDGIAKACAKVCECLFSSQKEWERDVCC
jgi:nucleoside-diphosphate-sugar epimerase